MQNGIIPRERIMSPCKFILTVLLLLAPASLSAQDTFCLRNKIKVTKGWGNAYTAIQLEHRTQECWFVRPIVGYRFTPWLKGDVAYEFRQKYSHDLKQRGIVSLTGTLKSGDMSISVRERYMMEFTKKDGTSEYGSGKSVLRSMLTAKYNIPGSIFSPYLSTEAFTWKGWEKARFSAGTQLRVGEHNVFDVFYMYTIFSSHPEVSQHTLGICYYLSL